MVLERDFDTSLTSFIAELDMPDTSSAIDLACCRVIVY